MRDMDRAAMTRLVYQRLANPAFRSRLTAAAPDGSRPIMVALPDDPMQTLLDQFLAAGEAGNVVLPLYNGVVVIAMTSDADCGYDDEPPALLRSDCTVGVFFERLRMDVLLGESIRYQFAVPGDVCRKSHGRAEVVALAG